MTQSEIPEEFQGFVLEAAGREDLSVSVEETGEMVVTCRAHDSHNAVSFDQAAAIAHSHDLRIVGGTAHFDGDSVDVVVADGAWQRGGGEQA